MTTNPTTGVPVVDPNAPMMQIASSPSTSGALSAPLSSPSTSGTLSTTSSLPFATTAAQPVATTSGALGSTTSTPSLTNAAQPVSATGTTLPTQNSTSLGPAPVVSTQATDAAPASLVSDQVASITSQNGLLMQQAAAQANEASNTHGLLNSSMAVGAAQNAVLSAAVPIATANANALNAANLQNAQASNTAGAQTAAAQNSSIAANQLASVNTASQNTAIQAGAAAAAALAGTNATAAEIQAATNKATAEAYVKAQQDSATQLASTNSAAAAAQAQVAAAAAAQLNANTLASNAIQNQYASLLAGNSQAATIMSNYNTQLAAILTSTTITDKTAASETLRISTNNALALLSGISNTPGTNYGSVAQSSAIAQRSADEAAAWAQGADATHQATTGPHANWFYYNNTWSATPDFTSSNVHAAANPNAAHDW